MAKTFIPTALPVDTPFTFYTFNQPSPAPRVPSNQATVISGFASTANRNNAVEPTATPYSDYVLERGDRTPSLNKPISNKATVDRWGSRPRMQGINPQRTPNRAYLKADTSLNRGGPGVY